MENRAPSFLVCRAPAWHISALCVSMKIINYAVVGLLTFTASLSVVFGPRVPDSASSAKSLVLAAMLLGWAMLLAYYQSKSYRGGAASIVGAILLGIGMWSASGEFLWHEHAIEKDRWTHVLATLFLIGSGIALLRQGHQIHKLRTSHVQDT